MIVAQIKARAVKGSPPLLYIMKEGGNKMKYEVFYQLGNQKGIGYFSDDEINYLKKNTSIEIISIKRGN